MADIDFITDLSSGSFSVSLTGNPQKVTGNRALLNRFEITFLTKSKPYLLGGVSVVDGYGGSADDVINKPQTLNDSNAIAAAISICIERTVTSMVQDQDVNIPDAEKIVSAELLNMYISDGIVFAQIKVNPVETDTYEVLVSNMPVIKR